MLEEEPDQRHRLHARGLRRLRGRRLRPRQRHGRGLRHLLRRRLERLQLDRRGVCREVAGRGDHRLARPARADPQSAAAPQGPRLPHAVRRLREAVRRRHRAERPAHRLPRDRSRARDLPPLQAAGLHRDSRATWSTSGPTRRRPTQHPESRRATRRRSHEAVDEAAARLANAQQPVLLPASRSIASACRTTPITLAEQAEHSDRRHDARQERRRRNASALHRPLRRGDGPRRGDEVRRRERLRGACSARS